MSDQRSPLVSDPGPTSGTPQDFLELDDLQTLLAWEMAHGELPPFVTMLTNQITAILEE